MKRNALYGIWFPGRIRCRSVAFSFCLGCLLSIPAWSQDYASQFGHALDANPRIGSYGLNTDARLDLVIPRGNLMITGNVGGGQSFQGLVPYSNPAEFQGAAAGIGVLSNFQRDSTGYESLSRPLGAPRYYFDPSRQVTGSFAGQVTNTANVANYLNVTPVGRTMSMPFTASDMSVRPFSQSIHPLSAPPQTVLPDYANTQNLPVGAPKMPWMTDPSFSASAAKPSLTPGDSASNRPDLATSLESPFVPGLQPSQNQPLNPLEQTSVPEPTAVDFYLQFQQQLQEKQAAESSAKKEAKSDAAGTSSETPASPLPSAPLPEPSGPGVSASASAPLASNAELRQKQFEHFMKQGAAQIKQGNYYLAANTFDSAAIYMPDEPIIYMAKCHALFAAGEYMSAAFFLNQTFAMAPDVAKQSRNPIPLFASPEEFQKRLDALKKWQQNTSRPELLFLQGYLEYQIGSLAEAKESLEKAVQSKQPPAPQLLASIQRLLEMVTSAANPVKEK